MCPRIGTREGVTSGCPLRTGVFNYTYTPQGSLASVQYPSGRTITYSFDSVAGRVTSVAGASMNYAANIAYWANSSVKQMNLGNARVEQTCLNSRMEPLTIRLGAAATTNCANSSDTLNLSYTYAASDNGNVQSQSIQRPGFSAVQSYTVAPYDGVNRLKEAQETGPGTSWAETYSYDAFGNRWVTSPTLTLETPAAQTWYSATNRIGTWGYDGSGNVTAVASMQRNFAYDAENRQTTATINGTTATYVYDGDGRRVQKVSGGGTTTYLYDAQGQLVAEYGPVTDSGTRYVTADHLGSTRLLTDASGNAVKCYDYYPFGGEIAAGVDGRPSCYSSGAYPASPDVASQKFTAKERDAETGLDWFNTRYFSGAQGRFTSPDELLNGVQFENPQSWNRYAYTLNNPLRYVDPSGHEPCENGIDPENGNICTVVTPPKQPPPPQISPFDFPGQWYAGFVNLFLNAKPSGAGQMAYAYVAQLAPGPVLGVIGDAAESGATLAKYMNILRQAARLKGNFGLGEATAQEAAEIGNAWVGEGATVASDGKTLVSADGLRQFRPPSFKPNLGKVQANFESRPVSSGQWQTNGHLDIK